MGKPSSTQLSRRSSTHSVNSHISKEKMPTPKISKKRLNRRRHLKAQRSINKLFDHLRESSLNITRNSSENINNSVIDVDDIQNTVIHDAQESLIIIPDDDIHNACSTPEQMSSIHYHSTPKRTSTSDLILAQSNNNTSLRNANVTREINKDSYLTIDLTTESRVNRSEQTVIDLAASSDHDVTIVDVSNTSSMSGDSNVTVLRQPLGRKLKKLTNGVASLNEADKADLFEMITKTIFNGCNIPDSVQNRLTNLQQSSVPRVSDTAEDTYIKEVILKSKASRCSTGSNVYHPSRPATAQTGLRMVIIDGSNVAMTHGRRKHFSVRGLQICLDYFLRRGHVVKAFVPQFRCKYGMSTDGRLLNYLERRGLVIFTPSREVKGRTITPYDDRYILQCAAEFDGVVVSCDNYRDLIDENSKWRFVIENRILPFTWVNDMLMFPKDPLGRYGPTLHEFLRHDGQNYMQ